MSDSHPDYSCDVCRSRKGVRVFRGARFIVPLCEGCAVAHSLCNEQGQEVKSCAVGSNVRIEWATPVLPVIVCRRAFLSA